MRNSIQKYRIGLAVLGLVTLVLLAMVLLQTGNTKADHETFNKADKASTKLNSYIDSKAKIPDSLQEAGIVDVPDSITYEKISDARYKFCATYKSDSDDFEGGSNIATDLLTGSMGGPSYDDSSDSSYEDSSLYISTYHHKGENCQKVKPYIYDESSYYDDYNDVSPGGLQLNGTGTTTQ